MAEDEGKVRANLCTCSQQLGGGKKDSKAKKKPRRRREWGASATRRKSERARETARLPPLQDMASRKRKATVEAFRTPLVFEADILLELICGHRS